MATSYLHGVETIEVEKGTKKITEVKTAVIGVPVIAPIFELDEDDQHVNKVKLVLNEKQAESYFGSDRDGYNARKIFSSIFDQGYGTVLAINVFDPSVHKTNVPDESQTFADDLITLAHEGVRDVIITDSTEETTYVEDTDYTVDYVTGEITRLTDGAIAESETVLIDYDYADPTLVTESDVIGTITDGVRTGMQTLLETKSSLGYNAKILIAPNFSTTASCVSALATLAESLGAIAYVDIPKGTTLQGAIEARGTGGTHNTSSRKIIPCYPHVEDEDGNIQPFSQYMAGVTAAKDNDKGYHYSPSNTEISGIIGLEKNLTASISDPTCDVNQLNEVGIVTVFNAFGTGFLSWGNRNASYPANTDPRTFINVERVVNVIDESIEKYTLQHMDKNITKALITAIVESVNAFLRTLIKRGVLIDGKIWYNEDNNTSEELADGHLVFEIDIMPACPAERITYNRAVNTDLYKVA